MLVRTHSQQRTNAQDTGRFSLCYLCLIIVRRVSNHHSVCPMEKWEILIITVCGVLLLSILKMYFLSFTLHELCVTVTKSAHMYQFHTSQLGQSKWCPISRPSTSHIIPQYKNSSGGEWLLITYVSHVEPKAHCTECKSLITRPPVPLSMCFLSMATIGLLCLVFMERNKNVTDTYNFRNQ